MTLKTVIDNGVNAEAMLAVADVIEYNDRFNLNHVVTWVPSEPRPTGAVGHRPTETDLWGECGTVGCVWGWTCAWADIKVDADTDSRGLAAQELGLTDDQAMRLFYANNNSIWTALAPEYGWVLSVDSWEGLDDWEEITASQAAEVMRRIALNMVDL